MQSTGDAASRAVWGFSSLQSCGLNLPPSANGRGTFKARPSPFLAASSKPASLWLSRQKALNRDILGELLEGHVRPGHLGGLRGEAEGREGPGVNGRWAGGRVWTLEGTVFKGQRGAETPEVLVARRRRACPWEQFYTFIALLRQQTPTALRGRGLRNRQEDGHLRGGRRLGIAAGFLAALNSFLDLDDSPSSKDGVCDASLEACTWGLGQ